MNVVVAADEWIAHVVGRVFGGRFDACEADHGAHARVETTATIGGLAANLTIFDWEQYQWVGGYCTGQDELSKSIAVNGLWEKFGTALAAAVLQTGPPAVVLDFGAHIGWFTLLAAMSGHEVVSFDADAEHVEVLAGNADANHVRDRVTVIRCWIGADTNQLPGSAPPIRFLKCDLEGGENHALRVTHDLFAEGAVEYAMFEVSPVFADHYPATVQAIVDCGYRAYLVPDERFDEFQADPLGAIVAYRIDGPDLAETISAMHQRDVFFAREDLAP